MIPCIESTDEVSVGRLYRTTGIADPDIRRFIVDNSLVKVIKLEQKVNGDFDQYPIRIIPLNLDDLTPEGEDTMKKEGSIGVEYYELYNCRKDQLDLI